jgi:hypothetical protein
MKILYKDFMEYSKLHSGQLIGYRTLMPLDVYILNKPKSEAETEYIEKATPDQRQKFYSKYNEA